MARLSVAYTFCFDAAVKTAFGVQARHGHLLTPQDVRGLAMSMFIETNKQGQMAHWRGLPIVEPGDIPAPSRPFRQLTAELDAVWNERHKERAAAAAHPGTAPTQPPAPEHPAGWVEPDDDEIPF